MYIVSHQNLIWGNETDIWYYKMFKRKEEWSCKMDEKIEKVTERVKEKWIDTESNEKLKWKEILIKRDWWIDIKRKLWREWKKGESDHIRWANK